MGGSYLITIGIGREPLPKKRSEFSGTIAHKQLEGISTGSEGTERGKALWTRIKFKATGTSVYKTLYEPEERPRRSVVQ